MLKCLWDLSAQLLSCMWLQRRGCFLRTFYQRAGLSSGLANLAAGWGMRGKGKNGRRKKRGRAGRGNGLLLFHFMASLWACAGTHTHPHRKAHRTLSNRQSQDVTSPTGREAKQRFFALWLLCVSVPRGEVGASRAVQGRQRKRGAGGGQQLLDLSSARTYQQGVALKSSLDVLIGSPPDPVLQEYSQVQCRVGLCFPHCSHFLVLVSFIVVASWFS